MISEGSANSILAALWLIHSRFGERLAEVAVANCSPTTATEELKLGDAPYTAS